MRFFGKKKHIFDHGKRNRIVGAPRKCRVVVYGDDNEVVIRGERSTFPCSIAIGTPDCKTSNCRVEIGAGTTSNGLTISLLESGSECLIGDDCMFSDGVQIHCSDTHSIFDADGNLVNIGRFVRIGRHSWIGQGVTILKNVDLPEGTIVGRNATVAKVHDLKPFSSIAGNPARVIKTGVHWKWDRPQWILDAK